VPREKAPSSVAYRTDAMRAAAERSLRRLDCSKKAPPQDEPSVGAMQFALQIKQAMLAARAYANPQAGGTSGIFSLACSTASALPARAPPHRSQVHL
jgi:hypothetical protein